MRKLGRSVINHKIGTYTVDITNEKGEMIAIFQGMVYRKKDALDLSGT